MRGPSDAARGGTGGAWGARLVTGLWEGRGVGWAVLRGALLPAAAAYGGGVALRNAAFRLRMLGTVRVGARVVSVGNVRVGGTGKTPLTRWLAAQAHARGIATAIVSRGYGGATREPHVVGDGTRLLSEVARSGDEAVMLARTSAVPVVAGRDRAAAARLALARFASRLLLCDDAFQHRRLWRDLDVVLVDGDEPGGLRRLLPVGPLREPLGALGRADLVLVSDRAGGAGATAPVPAVRAPTTGLRLAPVGLAVPAAAGWEEAALATLVGRRVLAVSGVARPAPIYATLRDWEAELVHVLEYPDHHVYDAASWHEITRLARDVDLVVTTEKDLVKLERLPFAQGKLVALRLSVELEAPEDLLRRVLGDLGPGDR